MATYPGAIYSFTTINNGDTSDASQIDNPGNEIVAIETGLLNGFQHNLLPDVDDSRSFGSAAKRWLKLWAQDLDADGTITAGGLIDASAAAAGQIKFPVTQNSSLNAQTLDDYQEGTWTPVVGGSGGTSGQTYSRQQGRFVKIGSLVWAAFDVVLSAKGTITGAVQIQGLPYAFENANVQDQATNSMLWFLTVTSFVSLAGLGVQNGTAINIWAATAAATSLSQPTTGDIGNTTQFIGSITYRTNA